jgi:hypothetical protein
MLRNAAGEVFGLGTNADQAFYVIIEVRAPGAGPIPTESSGGPGMISAASLTVDQSNYSGACPVTLAFSGSITSQGTGSFEYRMEAGSSTSGFSFFLPPKLKATYDSGGSHSLNIAYTLEIESSVQGWARVTVDPPHSFSSSQVNFSVTCQ